MKGFGWLLIGFVRVGRGNERWRESHLSGKVMLLIMPWEIITSWLRYN